MKLSVGFDYVNRKEVFNIKDYQEKVNQVDDMINNLTGEGSDYLGWLHYASTFDPKELERIQAKAQEFRENYDIMVVCGIGGSYLGARAAIEAIKGLMKKDDQMNVVFAGNTLDPNYLSDIITLVKNKRFCICVISKSGTTTETSISFRIFKELLEEKVGKATASKAIVAITDLEKGALRQLATEEGYDTFELPANVGGRFSVITPVGLFPIACAGIDIFKFMQGVVDAEIKYSQKDITKNAAYKYACERNFLYKKGYKVELFVAYEPRLASLNEWLKQLFDESEGKNGKGLFATSSIFTTDLHSLGQFVQEGSKILYETVLYFTSTKNDILIPYDDANLDKLNYIAGKTLSFVNSKAHEGTLTAHAFEGNVPNITLTFDELNAKNLGHIFYFFMKTCAMSAYLLGVNPFNQNGVEVYKSNMFHLLGKPGF